MMTVEMFWKLTKPKGESDVGDRDLMMIATLLHSFHLANKEGDTAGMIANCKSLLFHCGNYLTLYEAEKTPEFGLAKGGVKNLAKQANRFLEKNPQPQPRRPVPKPRVVVPKKVPLPPPLPPLPANVQKPTPARRGSKPSTLTTPPVLRPLPNPRPGRDIPERGTTTLPDFEKLISICKVQTVQMYMQGEDLRADEEETRGDELISHGWCLAMVIYWLRAYRHKKSFWPWALSEEAVPYFRFAMAFQKMWGSSVGGLTSTAEGHPMQFKKLGLIRSDGVGFDNVVTPGGKAIVEAVHRLESPYCMIVLFGNGAHSLGLFKGAKNQYRFMDPNFGEYHIKGKKYLGAFIEGLIRLYYENYKYAYADLYHEG
ncbi:MAG: hypothetical protein MI742_02605 [Desulfobacterales bacterium]|nr:hypothetical protein [Desulfobacterales bacterium]